MYFYETFSRFDGKAHACDTETEGNAVAYTRDSMRCAGKKCGWPKFRPTDD